jgi:hypothetical protein
MLDQGKHVAGEQKIDDKQPTKNRTPKSRIHVFVPATLPNHIQKNIKRKDSECNGQKRPKNVMLRL